MKKVYPDAKAALADVLRDGMLICCGGFGVFRPLAVDAIELRAQRRPDHRVDAALIAPRGNVCSTDGETRR